MKPAEFTIPGTPVAKARPRVVRAGGTVRTFTPARSTRYEDTVRLFATRAGVRCHDGPVALDLVLYWPSKGPPRKREPRAECWKATRPDLDNVLKAILDGLSGCAFVDDGQVCSVSIRKLHAAQGDPARAVVRVVALEGGA